MIEELVVPGPRPSLPDPSTVPLERLEAQICELAGHLAAATGRFLVLIGEFDARQGWASWDQGSCSAWLAWKCQLSRGAAREHVRVARALRDLPVLTAELTAGRMSYAKLRALTRIATRQTEADLAELAGPMTASQLERFTAAHRRVSNADDQLARDSRRLSVRVEDDGSVAISVRLPAVEGAVVLKALRAAVGDLDHPHRPASAVLAGTVPAESAPADGVSAETPSPEVPHDPVIDAGVRDSTSLADALVELSRSFLAGKIAAAGNPDIYQIIVHVGPEALNSSPPNSSPPNSSPLARPAWHPADPARCHLEDGPAISPATAQRLACQAAVSWMLHDHDGTLLDVGRRHRRPPPPLRNAVRERDRWRCQYPGCNSRRTDIHHIQPWARGGKTRLRDLILLCEAHHVIVHAAGLLIVDDGSGGFTICRADGTPIPACPPLPAVSGDIATRHDADITADTIIPAGLGDRLNLDLAIWACFANARIAAERDQVVSLPPTRQ
jgi:Domain of unknown function (DUF222)/HNH endonuclease